LVFFIPGHDSTVRVNGRVRAVDASELPHVHLEVHHPDEKASNLWDVEAISKNVATPPIGTKEPGI
jgi:hypothetical protein